MHSPVRHLLGDELDHRVQQLARRGGEGRLRPADLALEDSVQRRAHLEQQSLRRRRHGALDPRVHHDDRVGARQRIVHVGHLKSASEEDQRQRRHGRGVSDEHLGRANELVEHQVRGIKLAVLGVDRGRMHQHLPGLGFRV